MTLQHQSEMLQSQDDQIERRELKIANLESVIDRLREALCDPCLTFPQRRAIGEDVK